MLSTLKLKRLEQGMTQFDLALRSGVSQVKISYAERGYPALNEKQKEGLAKALGVRMEEIWPEETKA